MLALTSSEDIEAALASHEITDLPNKSCTIRGQKEETDLEKLREKERIRSGKELGAAKRLEEELQLKRNLEARRIEKEEEQRAREKIKAKLGAPPSRPPASESSAGKLIRSGGSSVRAAET